MPKRKKPAGKYMCGRLQNKTTGQWLWVDSPKKRKGDWGYTTKPADHLLLSVGQARRFAADMRAVGASFVCTQIKD